MNKPKRLRDIPLYIMVSQAEREQIQERMAEVGTTNMAAFIRKMALIGYVLHVDLSPVKELVSLQRRCANNLNQVAINANSYGIYPQEIAALAARAAALKHVAYYQLIPYHPLAQVKYSALGRDFASEYATPSAAKLAELEAVARAFLPVYTLRGGIQ